MNDENKNQVDINFINIVMSLSQAAIMYMGKISNPQSGKIEKNLQLARTNIDILQMLQNKTKGNLTSKENEILSENLTNLQLTYADEKKREAQATKEKVEEDSPEKDKSQAAEKENSDSSSEKKEEENKNKDNK